MILCRRHLEGRSQEAPCQTRDKYTIQTKANLGSLLGEEVRGEKRSASGERSNGREERGREMQREEEKEEEREVRGVSPFKGTGYSLLCI